MNSLDSDEDKNNEGSDYTADSDQEICARLNLLLKEDLTLT